MALAPFVEPGDARRLKSKGPVRFPAGPWVTLCRCYQHAHAQDTLPKGFQFVVVRLFMQPNMAAE